LLHPNRHKLLFSAFLARRRRKGFPLIRDFPNLTIAPSDSLEASLFFRVATKPETVHRLESNRATESFDWARLTAFALLENAITVLDERVSKLPESCLPPDERERIARLALVWKLKLRLLERRLYESIRVLSKAGIEVTLLKGAAIALTAYGRFEDRPMADVDLLVDPERASEAHQLLQQNGWRLEIAGHPSDAWDEHHHLPPLSDTSGSGLRLELHLGPIPPGHPFKFDLADVRANSEVVEKEGIRVRVLEPHMHAVHAAIHFAWCHQFATGSTNVFRDLAAIEGTPGFSWQRFVSLARQTRSETSCYWTLRLARVLTDLPVPHGVLTALAPDMSEPLLAVLERHLAQLVLRSERACPSVTLRNRLWAFALQTERIDPDEALQWSSGAREPGPPTIRLLRRLPSHLRRVRTWSLYVASLFTTFI
jgi:hypothetical protein